MSGEEDDDWFERGARGEPPAEAADLDDDWFEAADTGEDTGGEEAAATAAATGPPEGGATPEEPTEAVDAEAFGEDFATAFEAAPGPDLDEASGWEGTAPGEDGFDDEAFDSSIPRIDVGIEGLDNMIQGGIPERSLIVTIGNAGTGKTTIGLQFIHHALERGEKAVYITLEEEYDRVVDTAAEKGWDFEAATEEGRLAILDLDPIEMSNSLTSIRTELPDLVRDFGASRLVLDSVSLLEMMYDDQAVRRTQIYDFTQSLKHAGVTTMLTSEASEDDPYHSRFGIIEYLTDAVFVLRYIRSEDFRETRLAVEIQKIRDANHSREMKPYEITNEGISVYRQANIF